MSKQSQKDGFTATQFDQALQDQITHAKGMNVPANILNGAVAFTILVSHRLLGKDRKLLPSLAQLVLDVQAEAKEERVRFAAQQAEAATREESRIVVPGQMTPGWRSPQDN